MPRSLKLALIAPGLAFVGVLLLLAPVTSAASVPFVATPSYVPYGGIAYHATTVAAASGSGSNTILVAPAFAPITGIEKFSQISKATSLGNYQLKVANGMANLSFGCPASSCSPGTHKVVILWNVTWAARLNTTCAGTATAPTLYAGANVTLDGFVIDHSVSPAATVGFGYLTLWHHQIYAAGTAASGASLHTYGLSFVATLTVGHHYTVRTYVFAATHAYAKTVPGAVCNSWAGASNGIAHPSLLESVRVT